jgi:transcription-repair coupling factor (superfamily II helicase)
MLRQWAPFEELAKSLAEGHPCLRVAGLVPAARALAVAELWQTHPRPALVVVKGLADAHRWTQDLRYFGAVVAEFPEAEPRLWRGGHHREADAERAVICRRLLAGEPLVVVATPAALDVRLPVPSAFTSATLRLSAGDSLDRELLIEAFERSGYERVSTVVEVGQWSARGGIVDVFSPTHGAPARLEFFGDDIESIRLFDPTTQRSAQPIDELLVLPLETPADDARSLLDYLPGAAAVILDAPELLDDVVEESPTSVPLRERLGGRQRVELETIGGAGAPAGESEARELVLDTRAVEPFTGRFAELAEALSEWRREGFRVRLVAPDDRQAEHLRQILREHAVEASLATGLDGSEELGIVTGECSSGLSIPALGFILLTEGEIFGARRRTLRRPKYERGSPISAFTDLAVLNRDFGASHRGQG